MPCAWAFLFWRYRQNISAAMPTGEVYDRHETAVLLGHNRSQLAFYLFFMFLLALLLIASFCFCANELK
jgi:hypothetical protein